MIYLHAFFVHTQRNLGTLCTLATINGVVSVVCHGETLELGLFYYGSTHRIHPLVEVYERCRYQASDGDSPTGWSISRSARPSQRRRGRAKYTRRIPGPCSQTKREGVIASCLFLCNKSHHVTIVNQKNQAYHNYVILSTLDCFSNRTNIGNILPILKAFCWSPLIIVRASMMLEARVARME